MPLTGLVSHWKLDEGAGPIAYDSGGTNHGAVIDAMWTTGLFGNALDFDGVDDYVQVANDASLNIPVELTISAWVKADSLSGNPGIVFKGGAGNNQRYKLAFAEGQLFFERNTTDGYKKLRSPDVSATNVWLHVVGLYDGTYIKVYENGIEKNSVNVGSNIVSYLGYPLVVGINKFWNAYFDGIVDYVSIYDRALSAEEIEQIYQPMVSPMFADAAGGDYHLLSERGRYRATTDEWILDEVTSPCIDGGDPDVAPSNERTPNGGRINIGAYGNTAYASMSECWSKADINCDGIVNFKDFAIFSQEWLETTLVIPEPNVPDVTPPAPVPAIITIGAVSPSSIMMTASEAFDESGVQYYFEALSAGGHDSGWIGARTYTDAGLIPDTTYCYRVKARDTSHNYNETIWSAQVCALTIVLPDTLAPLPNPMQWDPVVDANGYDGLPREIFMSPYGAFDYGATMRAIDADDQAPVSVPVAEVEYYFECIDESGFNSGWRTVAAYPNELERRTYTVKLGATGQYLRFRVKARDASDNHNETDWSITYPVMVP